MRWFPCRHSRAHFQSVYKAISCQKELHSVDFRQEDITDPQLVALAETLVEMPMISSLDLRDNRITDDVRVEHLIFVLFLFSLVATRTLCDGLFSLCRLRANRERKRCSRCCVSISLLPSRR